MRLNDTFGPARSQILLMDPLPSVSKAFALIIQEEHQRSMPLLPTPSSSIALAVSQTSNLMKTPGYSQSSRSCRDRPVCTHYGLIGHTIDRCYKIHGYPPGYKPKNARDVTTTGNSSNSPATIALTATPSSQEIRDSAIAQCHNILVVLQTTLATTQPASDFTSFHVTGQVHYEDDWQG